MYFSVKNVDADRNKAWRYGMGHFDCDHGSRGRHNFVEHFTAKDDSAENSHEDPGQNFV